MTRLENNDHYLLARQACAIREIGDIVAERFTLLRRYELYIINQTFVELAYNRYRKMASIRNVRPLRESDDLKPYLDKIKLRIRP